MAKKKFKAYRSPHDNTPFRRAWKKDYSSKDSPIKGWGEDLMRGMGGYGGSKLADTLYGEEESGNQYQTGIDEALQGFKAIGTENLMAGAKNTFAGARNTYEGLDTKFKNEFAGMQNLYKDMDEISTQNVYEDLTVNQQQAQFQSQQGAQQRANIMQNLQGAAGGSGVAGLAQAMANQGQLQTQQISASIGEQESRNQQLRARGAENIQRQQAQRQEMIARGGMDVQTQIATGATTAQQMRQQNMQAIAQGGMQSQQMRMQGAMEAQKLQFQGASDARNIQFQREQGLLSYYSGQQQAERENEQASKSWLERTLG